jgi:hypothetical protein
MRFAGLRARCLLAALALVLLGASSAAERDQRSDASVRRLLWRDPGPIASRDFVWRDTREFKRPVPPFTFIKEDTSGTRAKVRVEDAAGVKWNVKLAGNKDDTAEVHAEVAAVRLMWALGYFVEKCYYVDGGVIEGVSDLHRASRGLTPDGRFRAARFKERPDTTDEHWSFRDNPFIGTRELSGLVILMTMINNWDVIPENTAVVKARGAGGSEELHYVVSDLGAAFGKMVDLRFPMSLITMHMWSKWKLRDYERQRFIDGVENGRVKLHYRGERTFDPVPIDDARWFAGLASQLTPQQVRTAFEAAGATPDQVDGFSKRLLEKIRELDAVTRRASSASPSR